MTMHTRYRATMQRALGEAIKACDYVLAQGDSALGTEVLARLERDHRFTLTALPVNERPTDPTEADPPVRDAAVALVRVWDETPPHTPQGGPDWQEAVRAHVDREAAAREALRRALVGGRPAAPTRYEVLALSEAATRLTLNWRLNERIGDDITALDEANDAVVALLSRSAAEPPEDLEAQRRAAVAESIYQRYADGYHPVWHEVIEPPTWNSHVPGRDDTEPMTPEQVAWLRGEPLPRGVAAEPKEHGDG